MANNQKKDKALIAVWSIMAFVIVLTVVILSLLIGSNNANEESYFGRVILFGRSHVEVVIILILLSVIYLITLYFLAKALKRGPKVIINTNPSPIEEIKAEPKQVIETVKIAEKTTYDQNLENELKELSLLLEKEKLNSEKLKKENKKIRDDYDLLASELESLKKDALLPKKEAKVTLTVEKPKDKKVETLDTPNKTLKVSEPSEPTKNPSKKVTQSVTKIEEILDILTKK
ncbi:MAG: hypothetical protein LBV58_03670 [Acholeplasmatales bacterium]|jgi:hypothetical protein|nr:hypothetical protein [Acholeplasmatales bacterium]